MTRSTWVPRPHDQHLQGHLMRVGMSGDYFVGVETRHSHESFK